MVDLTKEVKKAAADWACRKIQEELDSLDVGSLRTLAGLRLGSNGVTVDSILEGVARRMGASRAPEVRP